MFCESVREMANTVLDCSIVSCLCVCLYCRRDMSSVTAIHNASDLDLCRLSPAGPTEITIRFAFVKPTEGYVLCFAQYDYVKCAF